MSDIVVHGMPYSNFVRTVRMVLEEKGVPYRLNPVALDSPDLLSLNPFGKVPAFTHGDMVLFESQAICRYIDDAFGGPSLRPGDLVEKARIDQWVAATCDAVDKAFIRGYVLSYALPMWQGKEPDPAKIEASLPAMNKVVGVLDRHLEGRTFLAADQLTLADLFLAPTAYLIKLYPEGKAAMAGAAHLSRWLDGIAARDSFAATKPAKG